MTQRFGRNKRRAAREAIAAAELTAARADEARRHANIRAARAISRCRILERDVDHIVTTLIELLGDTHVAVPLRYTREIKSAGRIDRWPLKHRLEPVVPLGAPMEKRRAVVDVVRLLHLVAEVDRADERLGVYIRFRDKNQTGQFPGAGLFVSLEEFHRKGFTPEFVDHLMTDVRNRVVRAVGEGRHG